MRGQFHETRWFEAKATSYDVPAFGLVSITGATWEDPGRTVLLIERPDADNDFPCAINSFKPIAAGDYGLVAVEGPNWVAYNTAATPAAGDEWGAAANSFLLTQNKTGFIVLGGVDAVREIVLVNFTAMSKRLIITFTLYEELEDTDETCLGTIHEQQGPGIAHTCTGAGAITLYNMHRDDGDYEYYGDAGHYGVASWMGGTNFRILNIQCPP